MTAPKYTRAQKRACAMREVGKREAVYPRLIAQGKMFEAAAQREIDIMREIAEDYAEPDLFEDRRA